MSPDAYQGLRCFVGLAIFLVMIILVNKASKASKEKKFMKRYRRDQDELEARSLRDRDKYWRPQAARPAKPERITICNHANPVMCRDCGKCIECNGGYGNLSEPSHPLCYSCGYYDGSEDDD